MGALLENHPRSPLLGVDFDADRIVVLANGQVAQIGSPLDIYKRPASKFVAHFIGDTNFIKGKILRTGAGEGFVETPIGLFRGALADPDNNLMEGSTAYLCIRPECFRLGTVGPDENCLSGMITNATYFGEVAHYDFRIGETYLKISEHNPRHLGGGRHGPLFAWVDPEDIVVLSD